MILDYQALDDEVLIEEFKRGVQEAFDVLLKKYTGRINSIARRFFCKSMTFDDFFQEGAIGLFIAAKKYKPERGSPFHVFAELHIRGKIINALTSATRNKHYFLNHFVSLYSPASDVEDGGIVIGIISNNEPSPEEILLESEKYLKINSVLSTKLTLLERAVLLKLSEGSSYKEAADDIGVAPKSIDNAFRRVKRKLAENFYLSEVFA